MVGDSMKIISCKLAARFLDDVCALLLMPCFHDHITEDAQSLVFAVEEVFSSNQHLLAFEYDPRAVLHRTFFTNTIALLHLDLAGGSIHELTCGIETDRSLVDQVGRSMVARFGVALGASFGLQRRLRFPFVCNRHLQRIG